MLSEYKDAEDEWNLEDIDCNDIVLSPRPLHTHKHSFKDDDPFSEDEFDFTNNKTFGTSTPYKSPNIISPSQKKTFVHSPVSLTSSLPSLHYLSSPHLSSNTSMVSESEDDFSELTFPSNLKFARRYHEDEETFSLGLVLPDVFVLKPLEQTILNESQTKIGRLHAQTEQKNDAKESVKREKSYLRPTTSSLNKSTPIKKKLFGDGTELDSISDLPLSLHREQNMKQAKNVQKVVSKGAVKNEVKARSILQRVIGVPLRSRSDEFSKPTPVPRRPVPVKKEKTRKAPTLIRGLSAPTKQSLNGMTYIPELKTWKGNEACLEVFEGKKSSMKVISSLQGDLGSSSNGMVFDHDKMCWIGNEEDIDIFNFGDDVNLHISDTSVIEKVITVTVQKEFILSKAMRESFYLQETQHKLFMGRWYPKANSKTYRDTSRAHLYEIRKL